MRVPLVARAHAEDVQPSVPARDARPPESRHRAAILVFRCPSSARSNAPNARPTRPTVRGRPARRCREGSPARPPRASGCGNPTTSGRSARFRTLPPDRGCCNARRPVADQRSPSVWQVASPLLSSQSPTHTLSGVPVGAVGSGRGARRHRACERDHEQDDPEGPQAEPPKATSPEGDLTILRNPCGLGARNAATARAATRDERMKGRRLLALRTRPARA